MAKMKAVQPEMVRLKELHKDDKVKLQQEMMALYRKRKKKINPASGCLPYFNSNTFFFCNLQNAFYLVRNETPALFRLDTRFICKRSHVYF